MELTEETFVNLFDLFKPYYSCEKTKKLTYYYSTKGSLKIRQVDNTCYAISKHETNKSKLKIEDISSFMNVFGNTLREEVSITIVRKIFLVENTKFYLDNVLHLGYFLIIKGNNNLITQLLGELNECSVVDYRQIFIKKRSKKYPLEYYVKQNKIFWVVNKDIINEKFNIKANDIVPCIFVEKRNNSYYKIQLDLNIKFDDYKYTAWRKFIGDNYNNVYIDVLLINNNRLVTLAGTEINYDDVGISDIYVDEKFLAKFDYQK